MPNKDYQLTPRARLDLQDIWNYYAVTWSTDQADRYSAALVDAFERLALDPELARQRDEFTPPVRIYRCGSHLVIYRVEVDHVLVIRLRHVREDWMSDPEGDR